MHKGERYFLGGDFGESFGEGFGRALGEGFDGFWEGFVRFWGLDLGRVLRWA